MEKWYTEFKALPAEEQARFISSFATTLVVGKPIANLELNLVGAAIGGAGRGAAAAAGKLGEALKVEKAAVAMTPEGFSIPLEEIGAAEARANGAGTTAELFEANKIGSGTSYQKTRPIIWRVTESGAQVKLKMATKIVDAFEKYGVKNIGELTEGMPTIEAAAVKGAELTGPKVQTFEQARNIALEIVGDMGPNSKSYICRLKTSWAFNKVTGRITGDKQLRWRVDWDKIKGPHVNIEDFRLGGGDQSKVFVIPFEGTEETVKSVVSSFND